MKEGWKEYKIKDVCTSICSGGTPTSSVPKYYEGGDIPWLNTSEVNFNFIHSTQKFITEEGLKNSSAKWVDPHAVIVAMYGVNAGMSAVSMIRLTTNQACCNLSINKKIADYKFVYYYIKTCYKDLANLAVGGAQQNLNAKTIKEFKIFLPQLDTQQKLASILFRYDDLIEVNNRRIALLEASARELYKEWFVRFRFPGYEHEVFKEGKPANWEYEPVTDILDIKYGKDHKSLDEGRVPSYGSGGIMRKVDGFLYQGEAVLIPRKGTLNNIMYVNEKFWTIDTMFYGIPKIEHSAKIAYYFLSSIDMEAFNSGAALPSMTTNILSGIKILLPVHKLMADFDILTTPIFKAISNLKDANNTLSLQRDRLLPRLLSGDLSVD